MSDKKCGNTFAAGNTCGNDGFKEAVCIHTEKVYDSCRE